MAKQRYINTKIWEDAWFSDLDQIEQLVFIYLLTNPMTNIIGAYELSKATIGRATGLERRVVEEILDRFEKTGKVFYRNGWVVIKNFIKHQNYRSPQIQKGIEVEMENLPLEIRELLKTPYGIDTLLHSNTNSNTNTNTNTKAELKEEKIPFSHFWELYPKKVEKQRAEEKWNRMSLKDQQAVIADLPRRSQAPPWNKGYVIYPMKYLNGKRWNDELQVNVPNEKVPVFKFKK